MKKTAYFPGTVYAVRQMKEETVTLADGTKLTKLVPGMKMDFYWRNRGQVHYLFTQRFTQKVYSHFRFGLGDSQLRSYHGWNKNPQMGKVLQKIPQNITYLQKYVLAE